VFESDGRHLEHRLIGNGEGPGLVFLHEGLGSMGLWREFPDDLVEATRRRGLVYSRAGHGWSEPLRERRTPDFLHHEALVVLPRLLDELEMVEPILVGHSDGASIALIHTGAGHRVSGLVLLAPHVFVEPESIAGIEAARVRFETSDMVERLARHHHDPQSTFRGWNDIWLDPVFRDWNIEDSLPSIHCPVLLIQALDDEYGTMAQLDVIERGVSGAVERLVLPDGGHSPHVAHAKQVTATITRFVNRLGQYPAGIGR
jgi:pimeloyl-ACP methyl ester carboxylesterase